MSLWTNIRDAGEALLTGGVAGAFNKNVGNAEGALFNKVTGRPSADDKRQQSSMVNQQIQAYKDQTALSQKQLDETRAQKDVVKRQINEKQIRALRNSYGGNRGFLNQGSGSSLGGGDLTNKLGT